MLQDCLIDFVYLNGCGILIVFNVTHWVDSIFILLRLSISICFIKLVLNTVMWLRNSFLIFQKHLLPMDLFTFAFKFPLTIFQFLHYYAFLWIANLYFSHFTLAFSLIGRLWIRIFILILVLTFILVVFQIFCIGLKYAHYIKVWFF